jgi:post-segregation antitoxin (ccd killing protein)
LVKLLNVRLAPGDARMAARLRQAGIPISRLVREAIRAAHARHATARASRKRPSQIMANIYREQPDPPGLPRETRDLRNRASVRRVIRRRLRPRRS